MKALDGLLTGESIVGAANIVDIPDLEKCVPIHPNPILLTLYGHRLAAGGSFAPAQGNPPPSSMSDLRSQLTVSILLPGETIV